MKSILKTNLLMALSLVLNLVFAQERSHIDSINNIPQNDFIRNLEASKAMFKKNLEDAESISYKKGVAVSQEKLAIVLYYLKDIDQGMNYSLKAAEYYKNEKDWDGLANIYADIGYTIRNIHLKQGLNYFRKALKIGHDHNIDRTMEKVYNNYGILQRMKSPPDLDSALFYHSKALEISEELGLVAAIPYDLNNMANVYSAMGKFNKAFECLDRSDSYRKKEENQILWGDNLAYRSDIYLDMGEIDSAILYAEKALIHSKETKFLNLTKYCLERLSSLYEKKNNAPMALKYYKELVQHNDSVVSFETNKATAQLLSDYNAIQKEKELSEEREKLAIQKSQNILLLSIIAFIVLIVVFIVRNYQKRQKSLKQEVALEKSEALNKIQKEKLRISRDLHDNIGSQLTYVISTLDNMNYISDDTKRLERINQLEIFTKNTLTELRETIWTIKSESISLEELLSKIADFINQVKQSFPEVSFKIDTDNYDLTLQSEQAIHCYRTIQEAINNALKYSQADSITISSNNGIISIVDNGSGFDKNKVKKGNGLINMRERIEEAGFDYEFVSEIGKGTTIRIITI